jgi:hypothetical protein
MKIGRIHADIAGDSRYRQTIEVHLDGNDVNVQLWEVSPFGGMDGPGGCNPNRLCSQLPIKNCTGKLLAEAIRSFVNSGADTIRRYGKATKNFIWYGDGSGALRGYSAKTCQVALDNARKW